MSAQCGGMLISPPLLRVKFDDLLCALCGADAHGTGILSFFPAESRYVM